jgi:hypothetical protein
MEQGVSLIAPADVRAMLSLFGETNKKIIDAMADLAKRAREAKGYEQYSVLKQPTRDLLGFEPSARIIYKYEPSAVPGLLQTDDYARGLLRGQRRSEEDIDQLVEVRLRRQEILENPNHPELHFIIGEAALLRPMGSNLVMNEQIDHLLKAAQDKKIHLYLIPFSAGPHRSMGSSFTVMQFADPSFPDLLYLEDAEKESTSRDDEEKIRHYMAIYNDIEALAKAAGTFEDLVEGIRRAHYLPVDVNGR